MKGYSVSLVIRGIPGGSEVKASASNAGDVGSMQETWVRSLGREDPLENPVDGGAWRAIVHGVAESDTTELLHFHFQITHKIMYSFILIRLTKI